MAEPGRNFDNLINALMGEEEGNLIPQVFRRWAAVSAVASVIGRRCWYSHGAYQLYPNLFIILLADSGRGKSAALSIPYDHVIPEFTESLGLPEKQWDKSWEQWGLNRPTWVFDGRISGEKFAIDWSKCFRGIPELCTLDPDSKLVEESPITLVTSEFGSLMDKFDTGIQMILTEGWECKRKHEYRTIKHNVILVRKPLINWIACAVPDEFVKYMPKSAQSQGIMSRMIIVLYDGPEIEKRDKYPMPSEVKIALMQEDLAEVAKLLGEFTFESEFLRLEVDEWLKDGLKPAPKDPKLKFYKERRQGHLMKVAMVVSAAKRSTRRITREDWREAKEILFDAERHMPKAMAKFGMSDIGMVAEELCELIKARGVMKFADFSKAMLARVRTPAESSTLFTQMKEAGYIESEDGKVWCPKEQKSED